MRLGNEHIVLTIGHETIVLRPSLRAAMRLNQRYGEFDKLTAAIAELSITAMADVVREATFGSSNLMRILERLDGDTPDLTSLHAIAGPLFDYVKALVGADEDEDHGKAVDNGSTGKPLTFDEYHLQLYRIGTGRLGWTPDVTLNATPREIIEAHRGRNDLLLELLRAAFGGSTEADPESALNAERDVAGFAELKAMTFGGDNRFA